MQKAVKILPKLRHQKRYYFGIGSETQNATVQHTVHLNIKKKTLKAAVKFKFLQFRAQKNNMLYFTKQGEKMFRRMTQTRKLQSLNVSSSQNQLMCLCKCLCSLPASPVSE